MIHFKVDVNYQRRDQSIENPFLIQYLLLLLKETCHHLMCIITSCCYKSVTFYLFSRISFFHHFSCKRRRGGGNQYSLQIRGRGIRNKIKRMMDIVRAPLNLHLLNIGDFLFYAASTLFFGYLKEYLMKWGLFQALYRKLLESSVIKMSEK